MCGNGSTLVYSPRRLVALAASRGGDAAPSGSAASAGAPQRAAGGAGSPEPSSGPAPQQPSGPSSPEAYLRNLKMPMPLGRKLKLVVRNMAIRIKTREQCCGHPGEPGC